METVVFEKEEDPWRYEAANTGGWALRLYDAGDDMCCFNNCRTLCVGCLCEACARGLARLEAVNALIETEMAVRVWEEREVRAGRWDRQQVEAERCNRNRRRRFLWKCMERESAQMT